MPKEAKRRFVGLNTEEVSLVDTPANEVEFLVVKNTEDPSMGATAKVEKEIVPVEVDSDENVTKALAHVNGIVEKIAGMVQTKKESKAPVEGGDDSEGGDGEEPAAEEPVEKSLKSVLQACGMDKAMMKTAMAKLKAAGFGDGAPPFAKKPGGGKPPEDGAQKTSKSSDDDAPLTLAGLASAVTKAAAFTPARIQALTQAQEILKIMLEAVSPGTSPDSSVPQVQTHGNPSSVAELTKPNTKPSVPTMKSSDSDELISTLKSLAGAVDGLVTRVEAIEKARPASNSADPEGATDTNAKKSRSIWGGVL